MTGSVANPTDINRLRPTATPTRPSIGRTVFYWTIVLLIAATLISTAVEVLLSLTQRQLQAEESVTTLLDSMDSILERAIWEVNDDNIATSLTAIISHTEIQAVAITTATGRLVLPTTPELADFNEQTCSAVLSRDYRERVIFGRPLEEGILDVCLVHQYALSRANLAETFLQTVPRIFSVFLVAAAILFVVQRLIIGRLVVASERLRSDEKFTADEVSGLAETTQKDELDVLLHELAARTRRLETAQDELAQAKRMEAVGTLTSSVAHEFNNLLAIILSNLELARLTPNTSSEERDAFIRQALETTENASKVTGQILSYSTSQTHRDASVFSVSGVLDELENLTRPFLSDSISLTVRNECEEFLFLSQDGLRNALVNLIKNAGEAITDRGTIHVRSRVAQSSEVRSVGLSRDQTFIVIEVDDDGPGVPQDAREKLFDPFFSLKDARRGVGLGLWTVYSFAIQSGGEIRYIPLEQGSRFYLMLPVSDRKPPSSENVTDPLSEIDLSAVRILLVDDEPELLALLRNMLTQAGAQVTTCETVSESVQTVMEMPFDLVICDLVLSDGFGTSIGDAAKAKVQPPAVALLSGNARTTQPDLSNVDLILHKPIKRSELLEELAKLYRRHHDRRLDEGRA